MAKDTYYFSHDFHSRNDRKMKRLLLKEKVAGVGIYWCLVEMLHEEGGYISLSEMEVIAQELNISTEKLEKVIKNYELFKFNEKEFWSSSALARIDKKKEKSLKARQSALYRHGKNAFEEQSNNELVSNDERTHSERHAIKGKEIKGKEIIKEKEGVAPPPPPDSVIGYTYKPDGGSYITRELFFTANDFNALPSNICAVVKSLLLVVKKAEVTDYELEALWESFKTLKLTLQKPYRNKDDVYEHFANWCKTQVFKSKREPQAPKKNNNEKPVGVEFINDFSQCKMSDGSIRELSQNETAMAKFQGLKPITIK